MRNNSPSSRLAAAGPAASLTRLFLLAGLLALACEAPPAESGDQASPGAEADVAAAAGDAADPAAQQADSAEQEAPDPEAAIIRLDPNDPNLEVWRDRDISDDPPREPGPIEIGSVLSFFGLPIARTIEDLVAGEVEVAFLGAPVDMGVGFRGAGEGPNALRAMRRSTGSMETMVSLAQRTDGGRLRERPHRPVQRGTQHGADPPNGA